MALTFISLTEILFEDALAQAKTLDAAKKATGELVGPLHGIPMTLKDQFDVAGYDSTIGYVSYANKPATQDAVIVEHLKTLGAVVLAKTNLPQSIMWCETDNPLWGLTTHPVNPALTPGGSTGGEGALLSLHGSLVGWGTDIGGSVRIPSHMHGLYGLKPSFGRLPYRGVTVSTDGEEHVPSVIGPLARSMNTLSQVTKLALTDDHRKHPWRQDARVHPIPWRVDVYESARSRPLTIGLLLDDGVVRIHPPVERVVREVAAKLVAAGHEVVPWAHDGLHEKCIEVMDQYYTADGGEDVRRAVEAGGEPFVPHVEALINKAPAISVYQYWQLNKQKQALHNAYLDKWESFSSPTTQRQVDAILMPVMPHLAVPHRKCKYVGYTKVWNFLDYTACVLPAGRADKSIDVGKEGWMNYEARNAVDEWNKVLYDPELMDGLPCGIQIVGRRLEEEKVIGIAEAVDIIVRGQ